MMEMRIIQVIMMKNDISYVFPASIRGFPHAELACSGRWACFLLDILAEPSLHTTPNESHAVACNVQSQMADQRESTPNEIDARFVRWHRSRV